MADRSSGIPARPQGRFPALKLESAHCSGLTASTSITPRVTSSIQFKDLPTRWSVCSNHHVHVKVRTAAVHLPLRVLMGPPLIAKTSFSVQPSAMLQNHDRQLMETQENDIAWLPPHHAHHHRPPPTLAPSTICVFTSKRKEEGDDSR